MRDNLIVNAYELRNSDWPERQISGASEHARNCYCAPARPEGFASIGYRLKATWLVFTGQADALIWPHQGWTPRFNNRRKPTVPRPSPAR
mgnify:CR=1 FL=1